METLALTTHDERETRAIAARLAARLEPGDVVALDGPLGAGKTCFVRGLAAGLGIDEREVSSPTFVIWHEHRSPSGGPPLVHVDAYRLGGREELETIGLDEVISGGEVILAVEWARRLGDALPEARVDVTLAHAGESIRALRIEGPARVVAGLGDVSSGASAPDPTGRCPICGDPVARAAPSFPFCSRRCRTVDLGRWLRGRYRI